jgi:hypothetical protein
MIEYQPSVYNESELRFRLKDTEEQNLPTILAEAGFLVQDLLLDVPVESRQLTPHTHEAKRVKESKFMIDSGSVPITIKQIRRPANHVFVVSYIARTQNGLGCMERFVWGVDTPEEQYHTETDVEFIDDELSPIGNPKTTQKFTTENMNLLHAMLKATKDLEELENG